MSKSEILESIQKQVGEANLFNENLLVQGKCSADFAGVSENDRVVVDLDKVFPSGRDGKKQCECIIFYFDAAANFIVVPVELKGGRNTELLKAVKQLKSGAEFADDYVPCGFKSTCHPVLFHKRPLSTAAYRQLRKPESQVLFGGKLFEIKTARCGDKLADVLP